MVVGDLTAPLLVVPDDRRGGWSHSVSAA